MNNPPELPLSGGMSITLLGSIPCSGFKRTHPKQKKKEQGQTTSPRNDVTPLPSLGFYGNNGSHLFSLGKGADAGSENLP